MTEVIARIENIETKKSGSGDIYRVVDLTGHKRGLFDWSGHTERAGLKVGDVAKFEHSGGEYRKVQSAKKVEDHEQRGPEARSQRWYFPGIR